MSEIDVPSNIPLPSGEAATRVTRANTTSDDSSAEQQSADKKTPIPEKTPEVAEKPAAHESAVTISSRLSSLEAGNRIRADYLGMDGQGRPLISSESGTYTVRYDAKYQPEIDEIPQGARLEIKILQVGRAIEARLVYRNPAPEQAGKAPLSLVVTLELTSLGAGPPKLSPTSGREHLPIEQQEISYQTTDLFRAENIARESASKLKELPLPTTTTNYTLYERAVPPKNHPAIIRTSITGNLLILQEQGATAPPENMGGQTGPATAGINSPKTTANPLTIDIERILHKNTLATVIRTFPTEPVKLPEIIQKHLGTPGVLNNLETGRNFTLRIDSIAVPDSRPARAGLPQATLPVTEAKTIAGAVSPTGFSGIIIAPGENISQRSPGSGDQSLSTPSRPNSLYSNRYNPASLTRPERKNEFITLYVATSVSIIKFHSPIRLEPGTVINFSLPEAKGAKSAPGMASGENIAGTQVITTPTGEGIDRSPAIPVAPVATVLSELPLQPLETLSRNWQSLGQILSIMAAVDNSGISPQTLNGRLPTIASPARMTTGMIFFLAAMGAKNPARIWLGPDIARQLEQAGQGKLLKMLDRDMQRIFRLGATTAAHDWRPALLPLQVGGEINAIPILTRQLRDDTPDGGKGADKEEGEDKITRFIVEVDLSQLGQIQLDGLLKAQKLNIIIRSGIILPPDMKDKMTGIFTTALDISGYNGDLQFRGNAPPDLSVKTVINQKIHMMGE